MSDADKKDFLSDETERKVKAFEEKLKAEQAALPDTSIRGGAGGINVLENYYFEDGNIPIYDSGTNKQIDRVDMEVDKLRRSRRTAQVQDEIDEIMHRLHEEKLAEERGEAPAQEQHTAPFVYAVPAILLVLGIIVIIAMNM